jgi:hypothetical protein
VSDNKDDEDGSDWLSSQFNPTEQVPAQPAPPAPVPPPPAAPPVAPPVAPPAPAPAAPVAPPAAAAPAPLAAGGFNWGLRPGGGADQSAAAVPPPPAAVPPAAPPVTTPVVAAPPPTLVMPPAAPPPVSPPTEPYSAPPTQPYVAEPTKPLSWDQFASTQQAPTAAPPPVDQPTEAYTVQPWQPASVTSPAAPATTPIADHSSEPTSAIDSLFGDHQFQDYEEVGVLGVIQVPPSTTAPGELDPSEPRAPLPTTQKVLMGVAGGLIAVLILIGAFFLGEHLGTAAAAPAAAKSKSAASATPTPAGTGGPVAPGVQQWTALQGGECIQPFSSAWAATFTVVPCTTDHDAQMVFKGKLPDSTETKYPTPLAFQKELTPLCSDSTAINYTAAAAVTDLQVSFSYPPNTAAWLHGDRTYYCFVDRVSGGNLPGDLSVPKAN